MKKEEKSQIIDSLVEKINANNKIYLADCSSLTVEKVNQFRRSCFEKNISVTVVKNSLLKKALERADDSRLTDLIPALKGATAIMFTEVGNAPAKLIKQFRDDVAGRDFLVHHEGEVAVHRRLVGLVEQGAGLSGLGFRRR